MSSTCPHCKGALWELSLEEPQGSNFKLFFVRCFACKAPIGVMSFYDTYTKLEKIKNKVDDLENSINRQLQVIDHNIRVLTQNKR